MTTYTGNGTLSGNYFINKAAPFDTRTVVNNVAYLTNSTFNEVVFKGMIVSVVSDANSENNGLWFKNNDWTSTPQASDWTRLKLGSDAALAELIDADTKIVVSDIDTNGNLSEIKFVIDDERIVSFSANAILPADISESTGLAGDGTPTNIGANNANDRFGDVHISGEIYKDGVVYGDQKVFIEKDASASTQTVAIADVSSKASGIITIESAADGTNFLTTVETSGMLDNTGNFEFFGKGHKAFAIAFNTAADDVISGSNLSQNTAIVVGSGQKLIVFRNGGTTKYLIQTM